MDGGILALILSGAGLFGGAVGWLSSQYWQHRAGRREEVRDDSKTLKEGGKLLEEMIDKEPDPQKQQILQSQLEEVDAALLKNIRQAVQRSRSKQ